MPRGTKCYFLGLEFDSVPEVERAKYLYSLQDEGIISDLILDKTQLSIIVQPAYTIPANPFHKQIKVRAITYTVDYRYCFNGYIISEDFKGTRKVNGKIRAHVERDSRLRIKMLRPLLPEGHLFRVCYIATAAPDAKIGYVYA